MDRVETQVEICGELDSNPTCQDSKAVQRAKTILAYFMAEYLRMVLNEVESVNSHPHVDESERRDFSKYSLAKAVERATLEWAAQMEVLMAESLESMTSLCNNARTRRQRAVANEDARGMFEVMCKVSKSNVYHKLAAKFLDGARASQLEEIYRLQAGLMVKRT